MKKKVLIGIGAMLAVCAGIAAIIPISKASANEAEVPENAQVAELERLAEQGDTAAMHRLIEFYDENSIEYLEIEAALDAYGNPLSVDSINEANKRDAELTKHYTERLNYWLAKGIAMNDSVAIVTKGLRAYDGNEEDAVLYLAKAADIGNAQAALFCGSSYYNMCDPDMAFKYLSMAYELGAPSAGWHLAMCYSQGFGADPDREKAIEVMRHSAMMNYPEAVLEMRRIEPSNKLWQHKADSLEIDFPDFPIIPDE